ncbi:MAG: DUF1365 domain-containing protein [Nevskiales bacterium]|nr:DUF1365 domain-containing protein [Nevskiales bacterium]
MNSDALYEARVVHRRYIPPHYRFVYRLFYLLLDLDRLEVLHRRLRWFSHNRFNLVGFHDRDHGDGSGDLRRWVERLLAPRGIVLNGGRIRLLALPRFFGFVFNPISLYYCEHADGRLCAVIAEVNNTFGERHSYVLEAGGAALRPLAPLIKNKQFHVSPFLGIEGCYTFRLSHPGERLRVHIHVSRSEGAVLSAGLAAVRRPLTDLALLGAVLSLPAMALKVVAAIHWEAFRLWWRGAQVHAKPPAPGTETS